MTDEQKQRLSELRNTPYGAALQAFLDEQYGKIGDILSSKSWEETLGRQFALTLLKDLFSFMGPQDPAKRGKKNPYE